MFSSKLKRAKSFNTRPPKVDELQLPKSSHLSRRAAAPALPLTNVNLKYSQSDRWLRPEVSNRLTLRKHVRRNNLEKRKSVSMDDVVFSCIKGEPKSPPLPGNPMSSQRSASDFEIEKQAERTFEYDQVLRELAGRSKRASRPLFPQDERDLILVLLEDETDIISVMKES